MKSKTPRWIWAALAVLVLAVISYVVAPPTAITSLKLVPIE
jgi:hypothetical protein